MKIALNKISPTQRSITNRLTIFFTILLSLLAEMPQLAFADYVGELETTKYFDPTTVALIKTRLPGGLLAGDQISYFIQFTPTDNGGAIGAGSFMTDYIPAGTQVVDAQFVHLNGDGTFTTIAPPTPAAVFPSLLPMYTDTGIFYSTDNRTSIYTSPTSPSITSTNGYALTTPNTSGCTGISLPSTTHNVWDSVMYNKYFNATSPGTAGTCTTPSPAFNETNYNTSGLSPVAGPNTFLTLDSTGAIGPWQRISYPGSLIGTSTGTAIAGTNNGTSVTNACVGGTPTSAGWTLSAANPLPINTNAVRFAAGKVIVGELFTVRITLKLTTNMPASGLINNTEVFGGDVGLDMGNAGSHPSNWNQWHYDCPAVAISNSQVLVQKTLVGSCSGSGCTPTAITSGVVPSIANLKLRYQIQYVNLSGTAQTNVILTDTPATGATYVANSYTLVAGTGTGAPSGTTTLTFPTIASLGSGGSGTIQYDVNVATAPADGTALINIAKLVSTQVPSPGVTSKAIATVSSQANLWINKATTTSSVTSGSNVSYTITIPNNGTNSATYLVVNDYLPSTGGVTGTTANDRFAYTAGSAVVKVTTAAGGVTTITPTSVTNAVAAAAPYTGLNREQLVITLPTTTAVPMGGNLTITFNAVVGSNVPASATPYLNNANVWYAGGSGGTAANSSYSETIGTAPVTVTAPMSLIVVVDCVYAGATCVPYTTGTIAPNSKIRYRLTYSNISAATMSSLVLTDTLPANTTFVTGTAKQNGTTTITPTGTTVLTFPLSPSSLAASASGYVVFDVQLGAAVSSGTDITDTAKITAANFSAGILASVTTSVRNQATLQITKSASPSTIQIGGTTTYTITVTNTGNAVASGIQIYDELPYLSTGTTVSDRFNFVTNSDSFSLTNTSGSSTLSYPVGILTTSVPPTFSGYTVQTNRQEILWTFASSKVLASGDSFTLTYTATAGANMPASATPYTSDIQAKYISATNTMYASANNTAPVLIGGLNHIEIDHNGTGLTCSPETLTIKACSDAACSTLYSGSITTTLNGIGVITFSGGSTTASLSQTTAGPFTLAASNTSPTPQTTAASCFNGATATCTLTFSDAGLILSNIANGIEATIPTQVAGITSSQYILRAVKKNTTTGACTGALTGTQSINFGYECNDPASCTTSNQLSVNGSAVTSNNNGGNLFGNYSYSGISLTFDANGNTTTPISFSYEDVGQITLRMQKTVSGANLSGNTNAFIVNPHHFAVDVCNAAIVGDCTINTAATATDGTGSILAIAGTKFTQTGTAFKTTVRSMSANNNVTPSYGIAGTTAATTETINLSNTCVAPIISPATTCPTNGTMSGTKSFARNTFSSGVKTVSDLTWDDVGVIQITATATSFMSNALTTTATSNNAGRFRPDHFDTVATGTMGCASPIPFTSCPPGNMVYSQQTFLNAQVQAKNAAGNAVINYQGAFAKSVALSAAASSGGAALTTGTLSAPVVAAISFTSTGATLTGATAPNFTLATATPAPAPLDVYLRANDTDGVSSLQTVATNSVEGGVKVIKGRLHFFNAYGSELLPIRVDVRAEFWDGTMWRLNRADSTTIIPAGKVTSGGGIAANTCFLSNPRPSAPTNASCLTVSPAITLVGGTGSWFILDKSTPQVGFTDLTINLSATPWLQGKWSGTATGFTENPISRIKFGSPKALYIYLRERY